MQSIILLPVALLPVALLPVALLPVALLPVALLPVALLFRTILNCLQFINLNNKISENNIIIITFGILNSFNEQFCLHTQINIWPL